MTIQQLLAQHSVEDIVRKTMAVYDMDDAKYPKLYANYAKLIETLLKLDAIPTDDVLLGTVYEDEGEVLMHTSVYKGEELTRPIPYNAILENTVDNPTLPDETLDAGIRAKGWPQSYSYLFQPWAEIMGYQINEANLEDVGAVPLLVDALYELTFFGFEEGDMEAERHILDESIAELKAVREMSPEEQEQYHFGKTIDIDQLWDNLGLPPKSPEEKAQERLEMQHERFRNKQRLYHALRRYCGGGERRGS